MEKHESSIRGQDILVFLTSNSDIKNACIKLKDKLEDRVIITPEKQSNDTIRKEKKVYENLILELNQIIISNYSTFNILHIITTK